MRIQDTKRLCVYVGGGWVGGAQLTKKLYWVVHNKERVEHSDTSLTIVTV